MAMIWLLFNFALSDDILKSNDEVMQVMAQYKKKVGENPNENGHATGMSEHHIYISDVKI